MTIAGATRLPTSKANPDSMSENRFPQTSKALEAAAPSGGQTEILIRPVEGELEARFCAGFIVASEPWVTLGLGFDRALARLTDPTREVNAALIQNAVAGVLILHLAGALNGYIQLLAVHPDWRGRGVGTHLIRWAEERIFQQSPNVFLCVSDFNHRARAWYERLGYRQVGALPDFVANGRAEILMRKTRGPWFTFKPAV